MIEGKSKMLNESDNRIPLDDEQIPNGTRFLKMKNIGMLKLVGAGGSSLVYLAQMDGRYGCVIKEYYPAGDTLSGAVYIRDMKSGKLYLKGSEEQKNQEKIQQEKHVQYECNMISQLYGTTDSPGANNNHILHFQMKNRFYRIGDTVYIVLQTTKGCTLYEKVEQMGKLSVERTIDIILKLIAIIKVMLIDKHCIHGDLKPENIWVGSDDNSIETEVLYLIDFGSSFYYNLDLTTDLASEEAILDRADEIAANPGIACSSQHYCSFPLHAVYKAKVSYLQNPNVTKAKKLLRSISKINESSDLFSVIKIFYFLIAGEDYNVDTPHDDTALAEILFCENDMNFALKKGIAAEINNIMRKNDKMRYISVVDVRRDLEIVDAMCKRQIVPEVWIASVINAPSQNIPDVDPLLFCSVKK